METNHLYSRSLATVLLLVGLVTLSYGQCGATLSEEGPTRVAPDPGPCIVSEAGGEADEDTASLCDEPRSDVAEAGILGYSDPAAEAAPTSVVAENGCMFEQAEDTDYGCPTRVTPWMPEQTEQEYVPEPTAVREQEYAPEPTSVAEQDYTRGPTDDMAQEDMSQPTGETEPQYVPGPTSVAEQDHAPEPTSETEPEYAPEPTRVTGQEYTFESTDDADQEYVSGPTGETEQAYVPGPTSVMEQEYAPGRIGETEQEYMPEPMDDMDSSGPVRVVP